MNNVGNIVLARLERRVGAAGEALGSLGVYNRSSEGRAPRKAELKLHTPQDNEQELSGAFSPLKRRVDPFRTPRPRLDAEADLKTASAGTKRQKS